MTEQSTYNNNINNIGLLPIKNEFINMNNMNQLNTNTNMQLNNYNINLSHNIDNNLNINNYLLLNNNNNVSNIHLNSPQNINNYNNTQKNIIFNSGQNNYYNNLNNNYYQIGNANKQMKLYLTSKHIFFNSPSLTKLNDLIYKDFSQIEKILTNYKFFITSNNYEPINICLKYIEFSNFFFDQNITMKISDIINQIIFSNNSDEAIKFKLKEVFQNMIPFNIRESYLREFFNPKGAKNFYNLFKKDLNLYKNDKDKIYYLSKIYEIVKSKLINKDSEEILFLLHKYGYNKSNINTSSYNYNAYFNENSSNKNGGNYLNINNYNHSNNNYNKYRKHSFQSQPYNWNESNYDNKNNINGNNNHNQHQNYNNNYIEDKNNDELGFNKSYNNSYNKKNNYKGSFSSRHYYNDKNMHKIKNKSNRKNSNYNSGAVLVEVSTTPKKEEDNEIENENENNNKIEIEQDKKDEIKNNILDSNDNNNNNNNNDNVNDKKEENNINVNNTNEEKKEENKTLTNEVNISHDENQENIHNEKIENEKIDNEKIYNENNISTNQLLNSNGNEENIKTNEDNDNGYDLKDENIITDFNIINPFNDNNKEIDKSDNENDNEDSTKNLKAINNAQDLEKSDEENNNENNPFELNIIENSENIFNNINGNDINKEENNNDHIDEINIDNENRENDIQINYNTDNEDKNDEIENKNEIKIESSPKKELVFSNSENNINERININKNKSQEPNENQMINSNQNDIRSISDNNLLNLNKNSLNNAINNININDNIPQNNINTNLNISNDQLQILRLLMLNNNNNSLLNLYPFFNQNLSKNNLNNNILSNANNLGLNIMNNINTGMNLLNLFNDTQITNQNNQIYFQNIENQNYINIFLNYLNEEKNLISVIKQNSKNKINQYIHQTNIDFLKTRSDICANEYNTKLKKLRENNPLLIKENMNLFEEKIILPVYQKIHEENEQRKDLYRDTFNKYKNIIMKVLEKNNVKDTQIEPYGSIANNFMTEFGDIDVCLTPSDHNLFKDFDKYLQEIREEAVENQKCANFIILEQYSKFFILKLKDIETEIDLDITVQYILPIINTKLIRLYSLYDQRFHILGIFLKFWAKKNHIHGALDKFLSSYALLILIIHYLQTIVEPSILPILQQVHNIKKEYAYHNGEKEKVTNLYFEEDLDEINKYMNIINHEQNESTVVELLVGFFEYYSYKYTHYIISISRSDKIPADENETIAFPLEDPFDIGYNPGKSMKINTLSYTAFTYCMKKELNNIISGEYFKHHKEE